MTRRERATRTAKLLAALAETTDRGERRRLQDEVVVVNLAVAEALAARYRGRGLPEQDLMQVACEGLVKAVRRFDPSQASDLLTFAVPTVRGELRRYFRDQGWMVRPPRRVQELQYRMLDAMRRLSQNLGREPTSAEICIDLGIDYPQYAEALAAFGAFAPTSLDAPYYADSPTCRGEHLQSDQTPTEKAADARILVQSAFRSLNDRDRAILYLRLYEDLTQREIGDRFGITQMQISRILTRIYATLRDQIGNTDLATVSAVATSL